MRYAGAKAPQRTLPMMNDPNLVSRRQVLEGAAALLPLAAGRGAISRLLQPDPVLELGAREAVERIKTGDLRAERYAEQLIAQYHAHRELNAINFISEPRVLEAARAVDQARTKGAKLPALAGLPVAIKDQILAAGYPSTGGNGALKGHIPKRNAAVVETLVRAGAIPFCMAACPDMTVLDGLMHQVFSHSESFGAVRNPYDPSRGPGGSSGGNGALLAARIVPAALGEDTNGSIRLPSSFSGVAGLRPSTFTLENALRGTDRKRYSDDGLMLPPASRLDTIGPMARTVADLAFLDAIITGEQAPAVDPRSIRIAIPSAVYWDGDSVDVGVAKVMQEAFAKLREAGCQLVEIDFNGEVRAIVGTLDNQTPVTVIAAAGLNARPYFSTDGMATWLAENAPDVTLEQMYRGRPRSSGLLTGSKLPPVEEQIRIVTEGARRYAEIFRSHGGRRDRFSHGTHSRDSTPSRRTEGALRGDDRAQGQAAPGGQGHPGEPVRGAADGRRGARPSRRSDPGTSSWDGARRATRQRQRAARHRNRDREDPRADSGAALLVDAAPNPPPPLLVDRSGRRRRISAGRCRRR